MYLTTRHDHLHAFTPTQKWPVLPKRENRVQRYHKFADKKKKRNLKVSFLFTRSPRDRVGCFFQFPERRRCYHPRHSKIQAATAFSLNFDPRTPLMTPPPTPPGIVAMHVLATYFCCRQFTSGSLDHHGRRVQATPTKFIIAALIHMRKVRAPSNNITFYDARPCCYPFDGTLCEQGYTV